MNPNVTNFEFPTYSSFATTEVDDDEEMAAQSGVPWKVTSSSDFWGMLVPSLYGVGLTQLDFPRVSPIVTLGSAPENHIVISNEKINPQHCSFHWDEKDDKSVVLVRDYSESGTFIDERLIGKGKVAILNNGQGISFGAAFRGPDDVIEDDYRYIYRQVTSIEPLKGMLIDYEICNAIGEGAGGRIVSVMKRGTPEWYAAKRITPSKIRPRGGRSGFDVARREITVMKALKHPNICRIYDYYISEEDDTLDIIMELVDEGNLSKYVWETGNGLTETTTQHIAYQLCEAMKYVHAQGITHRDLKPTNILVRRDDPPIIKVADFGDARMEDDTTLMRTSCGTAYYVAPELRSKTRMKHGYTNRVDSFGVGAVLYYCLTLNIPFTVEGPTVKDMNMDSHIQTRKRDLTGLRTRAVSKEVRDIVRRLLSTNPERRYTMREVLAHAWFEGYKPPHVFPADAYEDEEMTVVRALTRTSRRGKKGKKRTLGRALNLNLAMVLEEEDPPHVLAAASSSTVMGADVDMALSTPMKNAKPAATPFRPEHNNGLTPKRYHGPESALKMALGGSF
ncbi:hypothetical protein HYPSUDRAFT_661203 [Hypholoma sublateritium FD-334 SS-4]|uniref:Protein kinase domain-containing protein n=1 Tax=Hypholoma sublateritium (strain FD-334 SS-4) TaxID=945553 RepID=A0A0D2L5V6_HYPSF|nr:hypothetical protein HYPSUDRAFT_661203 [Hypholoma sublateritium FD-334 SS-4]